MIKMFAYDNINTMGFLSCELGDCTVNIISVFLMMVTALIIVFVYIYRVTLGYSKRNIVQLLAKLKK